MPSIYHLDICHSKNNEKNENAFNVKSFFLYLFQKVIQTIIQRYIFDIQREAEVTEGTQKIYLIETTIKYLFTYYHILLVEEAKMNLCFIIQTILKKLNRIYLVFDTKC